MVLISRLICATETPSTAGAMSLRMRCTPSSRQAGSKRGNMPIFASAGKLDRQLQSAAQKHRPGQCQNRRIEPGRCEQRHADE